MEHGPDTKPLGFAVPLHRAGVEETALPPPCATETGRAGLLLQHRLGDTTLSTPQPHNVPQHGDAVPLPGTSTACQCG